VLTLEYGGAKKKKEAASKVGKQMLRREGVGPLNLNLRAEQNIKTGRIIPIYRRKVSKKEGTSFVISISKGNSAQAVL